MLINILLLSMGFETTNYGHKHVVAHRTILCYQLSQNRVKNNLGALKNDEEHSVKDGILEIYVLPKEKVMPINEVISDVKKWLIQ